MKTVHACLAIVADDGGATGSRFNVIVARPASSIFNFELALAFLAICVPSGVCVAKNFPKKIYTTPCSAIYSSNF